MNPRGEGQWGTSSSLCSENQGPEAEAAWECLGSAGAPVQLCTNHLVPSEYSTTAFVSKSLSIFLKFNFLYPFKPSYADLCAPISRNGVNLKTPSPEIHAGSHLECGNLIAEHSTLEWNRPALGQHGLACV